MTDRPVSALSAGPSSAPSGIAAIVVTHGSAPVLAEVLDGVARQTLPPDVVVVVRAGDPDQGSRQQSRPDLTWVEAPRARTLGQAVRTAAASEEASLALAGVRWWWILHDDSVPEPTCLRELWTVADRGRTIAVVGPSQVAMDGTHLLEVGIMATRSARRLDTIAPGEIDQGQYDSRSDVLAVGTAGMLVSREVWQGLAGLDPALGPFDDGLEFGRRVRRAGHRVVVAPRARIRHARDSLDPSSAERGGVPGGLPLGDEGDSPVTHPDDSREAAEPEQDRHDAHPAHATPPRHFDGSFRARRTAQLYTWMAAVAWWQAPLIALWLVVWTPLRALGRTLTGARQLAGEELAAWLALIRQTPALARGRRRAARQAQLPRSALREVEARPRDIAAYRRLNRRIHRSQRREHAVDPLVSASTRRFRRRSGGALAVLLAVLVVASLVAWHRMLGGFSGAAWAAAPGTWTDLWTAAWAAWIPGGSGQVGPGDPVEIPLALLSAPFALVGAAPTTVWTGVVILAAPLAALAAWPLFACLTTTVPVRVAGALAWAATPAVTVAASQGRLAAVVAHLALPLALLGWIRMTRGSAPLVVDGATGAVPVGDRRRASWAPGVAALALVAVVAAAPWLLGAALVALLASLPWTGRRGPSLLLTLVPGAILIAPFTVSALTTAGGWAALLTPGGPGLAEDAAPAWQLALAVPGSTSWMAPAILSAGVTVATLAGVLVGVVAHPPAWRVALAPLVVALAATATALAVSRVDTGVARSTPADGAPTLVVTHAWPGPALSVAVLALLVAAASVGATFGGGSAWDDRAHRPVAVAAGIVAAAAAVTWGVWAWTGPMAATDGATGHVGAFSGRLVPAITREAQNSTRQARLLVLTRVGDTLEADLLRGDGPSLTDSSALTRVHDLTALRAGDQDVATQDLARTAQTLVTVPDDQTAGSLAAHAVDGVLVPDAQSAPGAGLAEAIDRAPGLERVGDTDFGRLWRVRPDAELPARLTLVSGDQTTPVDSEALTARTQLPPDSRGTLVLAERADPAWRATLDGLELPAVEDPGIGAASNAAGWRQAFAVDHGGDLRLEFRPWWLLPWRLAGGVALVLAGLAALPTRRHR